MRKFYSYIVAAILMAGFIGAQSNVAVGQIRNSAGFSLTGLPSGATSSSTSGSITGTASETWNWSATFASSASNTAQNSSWQIGSKNNTCSQVVFSTTISGATITQIDVNCGAQSGKGSVNCTVGGSNFGTQGQSAGAGNNPSSYGDTPSFTGEATGEIQITINNTGTYISVKSIAVTYSTGGAVTYTMTYNANGATSGTAPTDSNSPYSNGAIVTVLGNIGSPALAKDHYTFNGWNTKADGTGTARAVGSTFTISQNTTLYAKWNPNTHSITLPAEDAKGTYTMDKINPVAYNTEVTLTYTPKTGYENYEATWSVNGSPISGNKFTMPDAAVTVTVSVNLTQWVKTTLAELTPADVFVIVGNNGSNYALPNNPSGTPAVSSIAVTTSTTPHTLTNQPAANLQWNLCLTDGGYEFYPNQVTNKWLNCTNSNDGVRVSNTAANAKHFTLASNGYLTTTETTNQRYLGIYNSSDWRTYENVTGNIKNQTFAFYKKVTEEVSFTTDIDPYSVSSGNTDGWYLIGSPVASVTPSDGNGFLTNTYDLYRFNQSATESWENYRAVDVNDEPLHPDFTKLISGRGYLYANSEQTTLTFTGQPYNGNGVIGLTYAASVEDETLKGLNLIGNPYNSTAKINKAFFRINDTHDGFTAEVAANSNVNAMEGVFVYATAVNQTAIFTPVAQNSNAPTNNVAMVALNLVQNRGNVIDRAIVCFDSEEILPKFQLFENSTKLYIKKDGKDYAIVGSEGSGEMPVNFKAAKDGEYTLTVNAEGVEMNYLHLIDNLTGADTDLLATPSYTFSGRATDYASRFRLVFGANDENGASTSSATFAYVSNGQVVVNGTGTLQVVDMLGRIVASQEVTTANCQLSTANYKTGVYVLRLVNNGDVKTQKMVIE